MFAIETRNDGGVSILGGRAVLDDELLTGDGARVV
jgi:hypothetical protein